MRYSLILIVTTVTLITIIPGLFLGCSYAPPYMQGPLTLIDSESNPNRLAFSAGFRASTPELGSDSTQFGGSRLTPQGQIMYMAKYLGAGAYLGNSNYMFFGSLHIPGLLSLNPFVLAGGGTTKTDSTGYNIAGGLATTIILSEGLSFQSALYQQTEYDELRSYKPGSIIPAVPDNNGLEWNLEGALSYNISKEGTRPDNKGTVLSVSSFTAGYSHLIKRNSGRLFIEFSVTQNFGSLFSQVINKPVKPWKGDSTNVLYRTK